MFDRLLHPRRCDRYEAVGVAGGRELGGQDASEVLVAGVAGFWDRSGVL